MKNLKKGLVICLSVLFIGIQIGCSNGLEDSAYQLIKETAATVEWADKDADFTSYAANVTVYSMDSRKDSSLKMDSSYKLSAKLINGEQYTRLDMNDKSPDGRLRSVVTGPEQMIVFDSVSDEIQMRLPVDNQLSNDLLFLQDGLGFGNTDIDMTKVKANRLSLDITESETSLLINFPSEMFSSEFEKRVSTEVRYDTVSETLTNIETVDVREDGAVVTTSIEFVYHDCGDGNYVKVGMITKIHTEIEQKVVGFDDSVPHYDSLDDIPEISEADFRKMEAAGNIFEEPYAKFGDPSDLSSTLTVVEVYEDIKINETDDSAFRLLF